MASAKALYAIENAQAVHRGTARSDQLGVRVVNASTLEIRLARADSAFLYALTLPMSMPCDEAFFLATSGRYGLERKYLICNGPFYLSKWNHDKSLLLKKNPDYQGETTVSPATVSLYINTDGQSRLDKLLEGRYDAALLEQGQAHALDERSGITTQEIPNITWSICFNAGNALLKNGNLRIALCQGLNRSALEPLASGLTAGRRALCRHPVCWAARATGSRQALSAGWPTMRMRRAGAGRAGWMRLAKKVQRLPSSVRRSMPI